MRALVTGAAGFVGRRLCAELVRRGWTVTGTVLGDPASGASSGARAVAADIRRRADVAAALAAARPDAVFHLAGISHGGEAAADPPAAIEVNVVGTAALLAEIGLRRDADRSDPVILITGSALQYGVHPAEAMPLRETAAQYPRGVYAGSKSAQEAVALAAHRSDGLRVIVTRSFNHSGAGQEARFQLPKLVGQARQALAGGRHDVGVAKWDQVKDWLHVEDVIEAYIGLVERGTPGEVYNVSRGEGIANGEISARLLARIDRRLRAVRDDAPPLAVDVPVLTGDSSKLRAATGWAPRHSLDFLLDDLLRAEAD